MARTKVQASTFEPRLITVSQTTQKYALTGFHLAPISSRKRGYGSQFDYLIENKSDLDAFIDAIFEGATEVADLFGDDSSKHLALCKDAAKL